LNRCLVIASMWPVPDSGAITNSADRAEQADPSRGAGADTLHARGEVIELEPTLARSSVQPRAARTVGTRTAIFDPVTIEVSRYTRRLSKSGPVRRPPGSSIIPHDCPRPTSPNPGTRAVFKDVVELRRGIGSPRLDASLMARPVAPLRLRGRGGCMPDRPGWLPARGINIW